MDGSRLNPNDDHRNDHQGLTLVGKILENPAVPPDTSERRDAHSTSRRNASYRHPISNSGPIDPPGTALGRFVAWAREESLLRPIVEWFQHFVDDRLSRANELYDRAAAADTARDDLRAEEWSLYAEARRQMLDEERRIVTSHLEKHQLTLTDRNGELLDLERETAVAMARAGLYFEPDEKESRDEVADGKREQQKTRRLIRGLRDRLNGIYEDLKDKIQQKEPPKTSVEESPESQASQMAKSAQVVHERSRSLRLGKHGPYNVRVINSMGLPVKPAEAAAALGVPLYKSHEVTEDDVDELKKENASLPVQHLKLQLHLFADRRFQAPVIRQKQLTRFGIVVGLFLGLSFGLAMGWLTPQNTKGSVLRAIDVGSGVRGAVREVHEVLVEARVLPPEPEKTVDDLEQERAGGIDGRMIWLLGFLGYAIAHLSRMAVTIAFATVGEDYAFALYTRRPNRPAVVAGLVMKFVAAASVLSLLVYTEVQLEHGAYSRLILAQQQDAATKRAANGPDRTVSEERAQTVQDFLATDDELRKRVAFYAALLVLSGYLIYAAGEGYLRGRDTVIASLITAKIQDMTEERLAAAGVTNQSLREAFDYLNRCNVLRTDANGLLMEVSALTTQVDSLTEAIDKTRRPISEAINRGQTSERSRQAYNDLIGVQIEVDRLAETILRETYRSLDDALEDQKARRDLQAKQIEGELRKLAYLAEQEKDQHAKMHTLYLKELDWRAEEIKQIWIRQAKVLGRLMDLLEASLDASRPEPVQPGFWHTILIRLRLRTPSTASVPSIQAVNQHATLIKECFNRIREILEETMVKMKEIEDTPTRVVRENEAMQRRLNRIQSAWNIGETTSNDDK